MLRQHRRRAQQQRKEDGVELGETRYVCEFPLLCRFKLVPLLLLDAGGACARLQRVLCVVAFDWVGACIVQPLKIRQLEGMCFSAENVFCISS